MYLHEHTGWTHFVWDDAQVLPLIGQVRFAQGELLGTIRHVGFSAGAKVEADMLANEVIASSRIEGVELDAVKVRSSVARHLGLEDPHGHLDTHDVDGMVSIMMDATKQFDRPLSSERLFGWHHALFPSGCSGLHRIQVAEYRDRPMSVVSGPIGRKTVHFSAPDAEQLPSLMDEFIGWFNGDDSEPLLKAGLAHLWFLTIHPFDDGNGRIARALTELLLARSDGSARRFYSMAGFILAHRETYYAELEQAQKGTNDVTAWLVWFLGALHGSIEYSLQTVLDVLEREAFWSSLSGVALNERQCKVLARLKGGFEGKLTAAKWAKMCKVSPDTALRDINDLIAKGVLVRADGGGRSTAYALNERQVPQNFSPAFAQLNAGISSKTP